jgi:AraC-like DNA-binding protein
VASFARVFRKITGLAPGAYRQRFGLHLVSLEEFAQKDGSNSKLRILDPSKRRLSSQRSLRF